ncbi:MAG: hypothetical protein JWM19_6069 [Actinomycetia bacterium]|nr:hypothetical protein [Actinomycetes bacterium]
MTAVHDTLVPLSHPDRFFIGGEWVKPSTQDTIKVIDSGTEQLYFTVPEAKEADMSSAVAAARQAFDQGPWPRLSHAERAGYMRALASELRKRDADIGQIWPRESGVLQSTALTMAAGGAFAFDFYADMADAFPFTEPVQPAWAASSA